MESARGKSPFVALKGYMFSVYGALAMLTAYMPVYFSNMGLTKVEISMLLAGGPFISLLANPFWGYWSDRMQNVRKIIIMLLLGNFLFIMIALQMSNYVLLWAMMLIFFFFQSPIFTQSTSLILTSIEGTEYKFGALRLWGSLGWAIIAFASGPVMSTIGVGKLQWVYAVMITCCFIFAIRLPKPKGTQIKKAKASGEDGKRKHSGEGLTHGSIYKNLYFVCFIGMGVLISVPNSINGTFMSIYIQDLGGSLTYVGAAIFISSIFEAPVFLLLDRYLKKNRTTMMACMIGVTLLFALRWFLMASIHSAFAILLIQMMHCITFGCYFYIGTQLTERIVPREQRASGQAAYSLAWNGISGIIAGLIGGKLYESFGPNQMYLISAMVTLAGVIGFVALWIVGLRRNVSHDAAQSDQSM